LCCDTHRRQRNQKYKFHYRMLFSLCQHFTPCNVSDLEGALYVFATSCCLCTFPLQCPLTIIAPETGFINHTAPSANFRVRKFLVLQANRLLMKRGYQPREHHRLELNPRSFIYLPNLSQAISLSVVGRIHSLFLAILFLFTFLDDLCQFYNRLL